MLGWFDSDLFGLIFALLCFCFIRGCRVDFLLSVDVISNPFWETISNVIEFGDSRFDLTIHA